MPASYLREAGGKIGVLTKTVVRSPVVRWLLHGRIRGPAFSDAIFVGEDFVHVKEIVAEEHLEHVATKSDFDSRIRAAKIFNIGHDRWGDEVIIKSENGRSDHSHAFPQDFLVLTLDRNELLFLYLERSNEGIFHFVQQPCPLPRFGDLLFQPGEHLAVDPYSRAVAVAANEREAIIYSAKSQDMIRREIQTGHRDWCPVSSERHLQVSGVIQHMDFLTPPADDEDHVILLLIVVEERRTKAAWVDWYCSSGIHQATVHSALAMDSLKTVSSLLIPLRNAGFMVVTGTEVQLWQNLLSESLVGSTIDDLSAEPRYSGSSPRRPIWTGWCRPLRSQATRRNKDVIYLVREDGLIYYVTVEGTRMISCSAGHVDCHAGSAFASLGDVHGADILALVGDMSTGRVVSIGLPPDPGRVQSLTWRQTMEMELVETIPNWATVTDMVTVPLRSSHGRSLGNLPARPSILVTSGRQPYGYITELRRGLEASALAYLELDDLQSITNVWALPLVTTGSALVIMSNPTATRVLDLPDNLELCELGPEECSALDLTRCTLAAAASGYGRIFQVTGQGITSTASLVANFEDTVKRERGENENIVDAVIIPEMSTVITVENRDHRSVVCCTTFGSTVPSQTLSYSTSDGDAPHETKLGLPDEPTALDALALSKSSILVSVALANGELYFFMVVDGHNLQLLTQRSLPRSHDTASICDHIVMLYSPTDTQFLLVGGLRDGNVCCLDITIDARQPSLHFNKETTFGFGHSSVKLVRLLSRPSAVCAMSGTETCLVTWNGNNAQSIDIESIWISDKLRPDLSQSAVVAVTEMPGSDYLISPYMAESLIFISTSAFFMVKLAKEPSAVPRQLHVNGTPTRLLYAEQQRSLVAASMKTAARTFASPSGRPEVKRQIWPVLDFIPSRSSELSHSYDFQPGEKVYALLEWSLKLSEDKIYSYILVGGSYRKSNGFAGGKIWFLQPTNRNWEIIDVKEGYQIKFDAPVYALALYDELTYVACSETNVLMYRFSLDSKKWQECCQPFKLASAGVFITVDAPLIYISTARDSLVILRYDPNNIKNDDDLPSLSAVRQGPQAEALLSHLVLHTAAPTGETQENIAFLTTKYGALVGLRSPASNSVGHTHSSAAEMLCVAQLPRSLTRLRQSNIRPKWKPPPPHGVLVDNIIGSAPDGSLIGISVLEERLWRRLSWLQRLCEWDESISPCSSMTPMYGALDDVRYERTERALPIGLATTAAADADADATVTNEITLRTSVAKECDLHIDGDILARILGVGGGGVETLKTVIRKAAGRKDRVGEWLTEHLDEELNAVEEVVEILTRVLDCWI